MNKKLTIKLAAALMAIMMIFTTGLQGVVNAAGQNGNTASETKLSQQLVAEFEEENKTTFLVKMQDKADAETAADEALFSMVKENASYEEVKAIKQEAVISELKSTSESTQRNVMTYLEEELAAGQVDEITSHYIVNMLVVTATKEVAEQLAGLAEVEEILPNQTVSLQVSEGEEEEQEEAQGLAWNVDHIKAPEVWEQGIDGEGIVVASIDTGADWEHPALKTKYRGYDNETGEVNHDYSWFDPTYESLTPQDEHGHGTHVTGTMVGATANDEEQIGVAPGAEWISVNAFNTRGTASEKHLLAAAEWILNPTNAEGVERPDLAPDIVNNSWGTSSGLNEFYREIVKAWNAAGIFPIFAAGNGISVHDVVPGSVEAPANYPESFAVGATDIDNRRSDLSLLGPSPYDEIKPDIAAPGVDVYSAYPEGTYRTMSGTSMASPAVAGTVALMMQAAPELHVDELKEIIKTSAFPLTDETYMEVPNNGFGHGLINAAAAVQAVTDYVPKIERIHGERRYDTAVEISKEGWDTTDTVILARADNFADALAGSPLAHQLNVPILLTGTDNLYEATVNEITRLGAQNVILLGGEDAIEETVFNELQENELDVRRIDGDSRTETAALIAAELAPEGIEKAFVVNGYDFPDALSAASYAALEGIPILLTQEDRLPAATEASISSLGITDTLVIGGPDVITDNLTTMLPGPDRIGGDDRYETNTLLAEHFNINYEHMYVATGTNFADVLTGSVLAAKNNTGVLLVHQRVPRNTPAFFEKNEISRLTIFGGVVAVTPKVRNDLQKLLQNDSEN